MPLVHFGTAEQRQKYLPKLASGEMIAAYALTEPGSGSDALAAKTKAVKSADGKSWKLTGSKLYITNAGFADLFTVFAKVDGEQFTAFLVERGAPGLTIGPEEHKLGIRGSSTCPLFLEDCTIPIENVLGTIGQGHKIAFNVLNIGRWKLGIGAVGGAKYCLELGVKFARERKQFGKPIAEFDLIRKKIGEIAMQTFVAESMAFRTAGLLDARAHLIDPADPQAQKKSIDAIEEHAIEASIIKVFGSEILHATADETLQIFGGAGYIEDYPIERVSRDARINRIFEGTNEINRLLVPGTMLKRALTGRLALMKLVGEVQQELADPIKIDRRSAGGPARARAQEVRLRQARHRLLRLARRAEVHAGDLREAGAAGRAGRRAHPHLRHGLGDLTDAAAHRRQGRGGQPDSALHDPALRRPGARAGVRHAARDADVDVAGRGVGPRDPRHQHLLQPRSRQHLLAAPQDRQARHRSRRLRAVTDRNVERGEVGAV